MSFSEKEQTKRPVQAKAKRSPDAPEAAQSVPMSALGGPSSASPERQIELPDAMRARMEASFGADLSGVKLYEDRRVAENGANAVAQGERIAFAPGMADFSRRSGMELLGHELSHVVSQRRGEARGGGLLNDGALEARADREGAMAAAGQQIAMPSAPMSSSAAAPAAGPMQAKKKSGKSEGKAQTAKQQGPQSDGSVAISGSEGYDQLDPALWKEQTYKPSFFSRLFKGKKKLTYKRKVADSQDWAALRTADASQETEALKQTYGAIADQQRDNLTQGQNEAMNDYIADSRPINGLLRGNMEMDEAQRQVQQQKIDQIDQAMENNRTGADLTTYRGVADQALIPLLLNSGDKKLQSVVKDGFIDHKLLAKYKDRMKGMEFSDRGYGSTSVQKEYAERWRKGLPRREANTILLEEFFKKYRDTPEGQDVIKLVLETFGKTDFNELNNTEQLSAKNALMTAMMTHKDFRREDELSDAIGSHMYHINVPKGSKAALIDRMRLNDEGGHDDAGQRELLIGRNARYRIRSVEQMKDEKGRLLPDQFNFFMDLLEDEEEQKS